MKIIPDHTTTSNNFFVCCSCCGRLITEIKCYRNEGVYDAECYRKLFTKKNEENDKKVISKMK